MQLFLRIAHFITSYAQVFKLNRSLKDRLF